HRGDRADGQVDSPREHRHRLAACQNRERGRGTDRRREPVATHNSRLRQLQDRHQGGEEDEERNDRLISDDPAPTSLGQGRDPCQDRPLHGRADGRGHARTLRIATRLPNITTPIRIAPWIAVDQLGSTPAKNRSVRTSARTMTAMIGPRTPPRPPARLTPPSTMAATLWSVYEPGTGAPTPPVAVRASPPRAEKN